MTTIIIISLCVLLLIAYLFDLTFSKTKIPTVILLFIVGWCVKQLTNYFEIQIPDFTAILPILGTVGLILIVLEGSLELELNASKFSLIKKSIIGVMLSMVASALVLAFLFHWIGGYTFRASLINAIPFCVISSSIVIPSVSNLSKTNKEFIIYESSLSDIVGVVFFNFIVVNTTIGLSSFGMFSVQLLGMIFVSFIATLGLSYLLSKITHHIKFVPIMLMVILIYEVSKEFNLPSLIFIMFFGLILGNLDELKRFKRIRRLRPEELNEEVAKFKGLIIEAAFLIRSLFFLLFGFLLKTSEILNTDTLLWSFEILFVIYFFRALQLLWSGLPMRSLLFVAPRGLITILLFLSILPQDTIPMINKSVVVQVVLISVFIMMLGLIMTSKKAKIEDEIQAAEAVEIEPEFTKEIAENPEHSKVISEYISGKK